MGHTTEEANAHRDDAPTTRPISADSHVVEGPEVFDGLADRFGDEAPRVVATDGAGDHIVIPARKGRGVNVGIMALAATRLDRVDQGWQREYGKDPTGPAVEPADAIWKRQFHATIEDDQPALRTRDMIGEDRLMWGSDYPHTDSTWPCSSQVLDEMFGDYPASTRAAITRDNVARLYGL